MMKRMKRATIIVSIVLGALLLGAVVFGILNATVGGGEWTLGWIDYRYDETGYEIGNGSVPSDRITKIDLDWIDGGVTVVACQDAFVSLTETAKEEIPEASRVRWHLSEDGTTLTIKYRKSSQFFGFGSAKRDKDLILRVPERFFEGLTLNVNVDSTKVRLEGIGAAALDFESETGEIVAVGCHFERVAVETERGKIDLGLTACPTAAELVTDSGEIYLRLPASASFTLDWESDGGHVNSDFAYQKQNGKYVVGTGEASVRAESDGKDIFLVVQ